MWLKWKLVWEEAVYAVYFASEHVCLCGFVSWRNSVCNEMIGFWISAHSLGLCICEWVLGETFACLCVYWWVCVREFRVGGSWEGCSSVCANEPLIFLICPSVCIRVMNQISRVNVSRPSFARAFIYFSDVCLSGFIFATCTWVIIFALAPDANALRYMLYWCCGDYLLLLLLEELRGGTFNF